MCDLDGSNIIVKKVLSNRGTELRLRVPPGILSSHTAKTHRPGPILLCRFLLSAVVCLLMCAAKPLWAVSTLQFDGFEQAINTGGSIVLSSPSCVVVDTAGNIYITDTGNGQIVEVNAQGTASVLLISGLTSPSSLSSPTAIAVDGSGNLYVADTGNNRVVKISALGAGSVISTGGITLSTPGGVALDQSGDIFIADTGNGRIVEVTSGGSAARGKYRRFLRPTYAECSQRLSGGRIGEPLHRRLW